MSRPYLKCAGCGESIAIGNRIFFIDAECYCDGCVETDILDESYFEEDDSHAVLEERILSKYE